MELYKAKNRVIGVDVTIAATNYAIVDVRGDILAEGSFPTMDYPNVGDYVSELARRIVELSENNGGLELIRAVGISCPSGNIITNCIHNSPNLPWKGVVPMAAMLRDQIGVAVALANNVEALAWGEKTFGSGHGFKTFVTINIRSGVGGAYFYDNHLVYGDRGFSGEIGHTPLFPDGRICGCGLRGCAEAYIGNRGVINTAKELMSKSDKASLMRDFGDNLRQRDIIDCCEKGDELAQEAYRLTGYYLGIMLAKYATLMNPEAFILTGTLFDAGHWLLDSTLESFEQHTFCNIVKNTKILLSELDSKVRNVLGASALAWETEEYSLFK